MPLTNAERQARHRARIQKRLTAKPAPSDDHEWLLRRLAERFMEGGRMLINHGAEKYPEEPHATMRAKAEVEFNDHGITGREMTEVMYEAGQKAGLKIVERLWREYESRRPSPQPKPEPKVIRKRRPAVT